MKKIGIDARLYFQTGVGTYLRNLLYFLDESNPKNSIYYVYLLKKDFSKIRFKSKNLVKRLADYKWHGFSEQIGFLRTLLEDNLDLMHFTYFSYPVLYFRKFISTVHDVTPLAFKTGRASTKNFIFYWLKHLVFRLMLWFQVYRSKRIMTPTKTVKKELINIYGNKIDKKIIPLYEGLNYLILKTKENKKLIGKYKDFFIYVGNFYPHKNVNNLIEAFSKIGLDNKLLLIGPDDYFAKKLKLKKNTLLIKNPPLTDLVYFYKNARAIIHPSLSEGFGLPLVEAGYFGTPIIASNIGVFREIWANNYISFDPRNVDDIADKISLFSKKPVKFDYRGLEDKFSFEKMTKSLLKIYQSVTQNS